MSTLTRERRLGRGQLLHQRAPAARRDHHREGRGRAVLHAFDVLRVERQAAPRDLVGGVDDVRAVRGVGEHAQGAALPHRLAVGGGDGAGGQDDPAGHGLARVVGLGDPRADVHQLGGRVGGAAVVGDGDGHLAVGREADRLGLEQPGLAAQARPGVALVLLAHELDVLQPGAHGGLLDPLRAGEEVAAPGGLVVVGQPAVVLERPVPRDLVHEVAMEPVGQEGRGLRGRDRRHGEGEQGAGEGFHGVKPSRSVRGFRGWGCAPSPGGSRARRRAR